MRSRPLLLAVTALLVVAVAVGGFLLGRGTQDPSASPPPTAGTATPSPQGSPSSTPSLRVAAAGGGTGLAPDALTRTGFPDTCAGSVQAATGYNTIGQATGPGGTRPTRAQLEQTLDAVLAGNDTSLQTLRERPFQTLTPPATGHRPPRLGRVPRRRLQPRRHRHHQPLQLRHRRPHRRLGQRHRRPVRHRDLGPRPHRVTRRLEGRPLQRVRRR